ncbi:hypothetical protein BH11PLA2_BH11PLA2_40220 [soil metagenome]
MSKDRPKNMADSIRARLTNLARDQGEEFQPVLTRFTIEWLLYRLSRTKYDSDFVLKGAMLFQLWGGNTHRPTRDLDLLGTGDPSPARWLMSSDLSVKRTSRRRLGIRCGLCHSGHH